MPVPLERGTGARTTPTLSSPSPAPSLRTIPAGLPRERWAALLELADEPVPLRGYLQDGVLHAVDDEEGRPCAAILVMELPDHAVELRAVAVAESHQGHGVGTWIVTEVCDRLRRAGKRRVVVGTASSGIRQLGFYQRLGFRLTHVDRDFFTERRGYPPDLLENGIQVRDMVWMDRPL
jgi:GNAT superfamily N-acetyltransferase